MKPVQPHRRAAPAQRSYWSFQSRSQWMDVWNAGRAWLRRPILNCHTAALAVAIALCRCLFSSPLGNTSSRPERRTVSSSVAQWRDPCISSLPLYLLFLFLSSPHKKRHFEWSSSRSHRELRSGETRFSTDTASQPKSRAPPKPPAQKESSPATPPPHRS